MAAQSKPLLHTWSLSLEWQFYIWMPLVVWLVWRVASSSQRPKIGAVIDCVSGRCCPVSGLVFVGEPERRHRIVLFLLACQGLGAVGRRIDRCRRDPAPIRWMLQNSGGWNRRLSPSQAGRWSQAASSILSRNRDGRVCSRLPADLGRGNDRRGATGERRRRPAGDLLRSSAWAIGPTRSIFGTGRSGSSP